MYFSFFVLLPFCYSVNRYLFKEIRPDERQEHREQQQQRQLDLKSKDSKEAFSRSVRAIYTDSRCHCPPG